MIQSSVSMLGLLGERPTHTPGGKGLGANLQPLRVDGEKSAPPMTAADGIAILRQRLESQFQAQGALDSKLPQAELDKPGPEEVANRVLGFVESRLRDEMANGADSEKVASMLQQARDGVAQGFAEARDEIEALGRMNEDLDKAIGESYDRITQGLDRLESSLLGDSAQAPEQGGDTGDMSAPAAGSFEGRYALDSRTRQSVAVEVKTQDGDVVTVRLDERSRFSAQGSLSQSREGTEVRYQESQSFAGRYAISVDGELDQGEMDALQSLFSEVDDFSSRFFGGDVQGAFDQAMNMGIDGEELASYSINLRYQQTTRASAYTRLSDQPAPSERLQPAGDFARRLDDVGQRGQQAGLPADGIRALLDRMLADREEQQTENVPQPRRDLGRSFLGALLDRMSEKEAQS
ncbi:DUF5610 domain-containing protein [Marinobacteraceae bacterium S3BR75-40.1]